MVKFALVILCVVGLSVEPAIGYADELKPRMVVLTDVSTWETDDSESLVRLMVHADLLEIEALIFTTGWSLDKTRDDFMGLIHDAVNAYEKDLPNLSKRSNQTEHLADESKQFVGYWPSAAYLRDCTMLGSTKRGAEHIGPGNDSAGSRRIIQLVDEDDDRPLWITVWGGGNTLAQAIWRVKQDRGAADFQTFLSKLRVYTITDQDREQRTPFSDSSHQWMRQEFEKDLFFIWDECAWKFQNGTGRKNWASYERDIQSRGHLGKVYPKYKYGVEGDTPAFLHLLPIGLNDPNEPTHGGWGGYFARGQGADNLTICYTNHTAPEYEICQKLEEHFYAATYNNFAARMDWAHAGVGNRNPVVQIDDDQSIAILRRQAAPNDEIKLDASGTFDPDKDGVSFKWWILKAASSYRNEVSIQEANQPIATLNIPNDSAGETIHVICEVSDSGTPSLTSYRRVIIESAR